MKIKLISLAFALSAMTAFAADLPQVAILATGGTIAGTAAKSTEMAHYKAGDLAIQTLIDAVPAIQEYASVTGEQIVKISSNNLTDDVLLKVAKRTNELLADPKVSGVVITHGTENALPQVEIIYSHANAGRLFVDAAAAAGVKGIIHAGTGDGSIHKATEAGLLDAMKNGMVAVRSARVGNGVITGGSRYEKAGFINAGTLSPQKARILLQLALTKTSDPAEIQRMFNEY